MAKALEKAAQEIVADNDLNPLASPGAQKAIKDINRNELVKPVKK